MAVHPLRPATHFSLGRPLPYQQANRTQAHPQAPCGFDSEDLCPGVSCGIRPPFGGLFHARGKITHVLLTRSPLIPELPPERVRLACVRHAANVSSEPGSNSPVYKHSCEYLTKFDIGKLDQSMSLRFLFQRTVSLSPREKCDTSKMIFLCFSLSAVRRPEVPAPI